MSAWLYTRNSFAVCLAQWFYPFVVCLALYPSFVRCLPGPVALPVRRVPGSTRITRSPIAMCMAQWRYSFVVCLALPVTRSLCTWLYPFVVCLALPVRCVSGSVALPVRCLPGSVALPVRRVPGSTRIYRPFAMRPAQLC